MSQPENTGRRRLFGSAGAMLLLTAAEAGPGTAEELDGELLACCAEAVAADDLRAKALLARRQLANAGDDLPLVERVLRDVLGRAGT